MLEPEHLAIAADSIEYRIELAQKGRAVTPVGPIEHDHPWVQALGMVRAQMRLAEARADTEGQPAVLLVNLADPATRAMLRTFMERSPGRADLILNVLASLGGDENQPKIPGSEDW